MLHLINLIAVLNVPNKAINVKHTKWTGKTNQMLNIKVIILKIFINSIFDTFYGQHFHSFCVFTLSNYLSI